MPGNFIAAGNPLPNLKVNVAGVHLPSPKDAASVTVWHVIFHAKVWTADIVPGLSQAFGPGWWFLSAATAFGLAAGLLAGSTAVGRTLIGLPRPAVGGDVELEVDAPGAVSVVRLLWVVGLATLVGYLATPEPDLPGSIVYDLRFTTLAVLMGILVFPILASGTSTGWSNVVLVAFVVLAVGTPIRQGHLVGSPSLVAFHSVGEGLLGGGLVLVVGALLMAAPRTDRKRPGPTIAMHAMAGAPLGGPGRGPPSPSSLRAGPRRPGARLSFGAGAGPGAIGNGADLELLGSTAPTSPTGWSSSVSPSRTEPSDPILNCEQWRRAINAGHFRYVVSDQPFPSHDLHFPFDDPRSQAYWTTTSPWPSSWSTRSCRP